MPKTRGRPDSWDNQLRRLLKREHGNGWSIGEQSNKVKLTHRNEDGQRRSVMLDIPWAVSSSTAIANEVAVIRARMQESGIGLREAHQAGQVVAGRMSGHGVVVSSTDWDQIAEQFLLSRRDNRKNTIRNTTVRIKNALKTLNSKPKPADGPSLMNAYARTHFANCPPGGMGRKRHLADVAALLRYGVERCGAAQRWMPLAGEALEELVGGTERPVGAELTPPVKPDQLARLLDEIEASGDQSLWMAVALVGCFGLRPAELAVLEIENGDLRVGGGVKRNPRTKKRKTPPKPRLALALELRGRKDGQRAVELLASGIRFPRQLDTQIEKAKQGEDVLKAVGCKFAMYLNAVDCWKEFVVSTPGLTPYSLRHGYAWRAHKYYDVPLHTRDAAPLMGHSGLTHQKHYGAWTEESDLRNAVRRATGV